MRDTFYFCSQGVQARDASVPYLRKDNPAIAAAVRSAAAVLVEIDDEAFTIAPLSWQQYATRLVWAKPPGPNHEYEKHYGRRKWFMSTWTKEEVAVMWYAMKPHFAGRNLTAHSHLSAMEPTDVLTRARVGGLVPRAVFGSLDDIQDLEAALLSTPDLPSPLPDPLKTLLAGTQGVGAFAQVCCRMFKVDPAPGDRRQPVLSFLSQRAEELCLEYFDSMDVTKQAEVAKALEYVRTQPAY
jgi:hypothetical protein